jgi:hypothetical protein
MKKLSLTAAACVCLLPFAAHSGQKIDVKTGLWEMTMKIDTTGMQMPAIPPDVLAKMSPEQRARIEAMKGGMSSHVSQSCVTEKELERGFDPQNKETACKIVSSDATATSLEVHMQCDGPQVKGTSVMKMKAVDREHVQADVKSDMVANGRPMNVNVQMTGKWLKSDCGTVKPGEEKLDH